MGQDKGYLLIEILVVIGVSLFFSLGLLISFPKIFNSIKLNLDVTRTISFLNFARFYAISKDTDVALLLKQNSLKAVNQEGKIIQELIYCDSIQCDSKQKRLAFKGSGATKYSGTVRIFSKYKEFFIPIGVGFRKIYIK